MAWFITILIIILGVITSNIFAARVQKIPKAFITIGVGFLLSLIPFVREHTELESEFFMMFIIAPILYYDAQRMNPFRVGKNLRLIIYLAGSLVILTACLTTVIGMQVSIEHSVPLALLIASIITPTDAVAAASITENFDVPTGTRNILEYESLFNDATGLVLMSIALTGVQAHHLSVVTGVIDLLRVAGGGVIVGVVVGFLLYILVDFVTAKTSDTTSSAIPIMILTPFIAYATAEMFGVSGILAVVVAALFQVRRSMRLRLSLVHESLISRSLWEVMSSMLNDIVFVLLGMNVLYVIELMGNLSNRLLIWAVAFAVIAYLAMLLTRGLFAYHRREETWAELIGPKRSRERRQNAITFSLAGVHGAVTLALAFSIPATIPYRDAMVVAAALVILLSLIVPTFALPFLLKQKQVTMTESDLQLARQAMLSVMKEQLQAKALPEEVYLGIVQYLTSQVRPNRFSSDQAIFNHLLRKTARISRKYVQGLPGIDDNVKHNYHFLIELMLAEELSFAPWRSMRVMIERMLLNYRSKQSRNQGLTSDMTVEQRTEKQAKNTAHYQEQWRMISNNNSEHMIAWLREQQTQATDLQVREAWHRILSIYLFRHASMLRALNHTHIQKADVMKALNMEMTYVLRKLYSGDMDEAIGDELIQEIAEAQVWQSQQNELDPKQASRRIF